MLPLGIISLCAWLCVLMRILYKMYLCQTTFSLSLSIILLYHYTLIRLNLVSIFVHTYMYKHVILDLVCSIPYSGYFSPGENFCQFCQFRHLLPLTKFLSANFFSCINDNTVDVAIFTTLAKIKSGKIFMQYTSASFGEILLP